ncbi:MAG: HD domain-containing phosphohydrolase [Phaeospirillum sp.]|nr:HD domain-containing phosphohydrolase [Phaeospirillum sp.]
MNPAQQAIGRDLICVVDANPLYQSDVAQALTSTYRVSTFAEQNAALEAIAFQPPTAVVLDENVSPRGGLALLREICCVPDLDRVPIICTATNDRSLFLADATAFGVRTTLVKPFRRSALLGAITKEINGKVERSWTRIEPVQRAALKRTAKVFTAISDLMADGLPMPYETLRHSCAPLVEAVTGGNYSDVLKGVRDHHNYSYVHSLRVAMFLTLFGHAIGVRGDDLIILATGGLVHDVGKMAVPQDVLNKPDRLTDDEMAIMRGHVVSTGSFLRDSPGLPRGALVIAEQHHEKLDGTGYPYGLKGKDVNELARMATIIDIFGALTDRRAYKAPMEPEQALHVMTQLGRQIDQHLLSMFRTVLLDTAKTLEL